MMVSGGPASPVGSGGPVSSSPFGAHFSGTGLPLTLTGDLLVTTAPRPAGGTISKVVVVSGDGTVGSVSFTLKKCARAAFPGSLADVTGGHNVVLSAASEMQDTTLSGWSPSFSADDVFQVGLQTVDGVIKEATLWLYV
jgi:hypothetical protein